MATPEDFLARAAKLGRAAELAALASEAAGVDAALAKQLLERAEGQAQMPPDSIATAAAAMGLGLTDYAIDLYAMDLYGQAEDACFEPLTFAELARVAAALRPRVDLALQRRAGK